MCFPFVASAQLFAFWGPSPLTCMRPQVETLSNVIASTPWLSSETACKASTRMHVWAGSFRSGGVRSRSLIEEPRHHTPPIASCFGLDTSSPRQYPRYQIAVPIRPTPSVMDLLSTMTKQSAVGHVYLPGGGSFWIARMRILTAFTGNVSHPSLSGDVVCLC